MCVTHRDHPYSSDFWTTLVAFSSLFHFLVHRSVSFSVRSKLALSSALLCFFWWLLLKTTSAMSGNSTDKSSETEPKQLNWRP